MTMARPQHGNRMAAGHDSVRDGVSDEMNRGAAGAAARSAKLQEERLCSSCSTEIFSHRSSQALLDKGLPFLRARWTPCTRYFALLSNATESLHLGTGDLSAAATGDRADQVIGMHFMNPVPLMKLVEIIRGLATDQATYEMATNLATSLDKTIANSEDFPAFIVNRILMPMINEAIYTLYEGVGTVEAIDTAMKLGANHPMGPLELADFIGLDTCLSIMQVLYEGLADTKYRPCPLLVKYVEAGWLGRKTQRGFYDYRNGAPKPTR